MKRTLTVIICILITLVSACSRDRIKHMSAAERNKYVREHNLKRLPKFDVPIEINGRVIAWLEYFQGPGRKSFERYLERSGRYEAAMREILRQNDMPQDLVYIALIESGFNNGARSRAKATGAWQFMYRTGKHYGLTINTWVDERRDPIAATHAASKYLRKLYNQFGDWYLAMASYNAGEGKVARAIRTTDTKDFWEIAKHRRALRPETRDYVPKFIAAAIIAKKPEDFGFDNIDYQEPLVFEEIFIDSAADFKVIAKCASVDQAEILLLNQHYSNHVTPPKGGKIRLPIGTREKFAVAIKKIPKNERITIVYHRVKRHESLWKISRKYKVKVRDIVAVNDIGSGRRIYPGQKLVIPVGSGWQKYKKKSKEGSKPSGNMELVKYKIKSGDTLSTIAEEQHVSLAKLRMWNGLGRSSSIRAGKTLKIYKPGAGKTYHKVKHGETLTHIARKYKVSTKDLMVWNNIEDPKYIKAGQKLRLSSKTIAKNTSSKSPSTSTKTDYHTLKSGETLSHVADKYNMGTKQLMALNEIKNPRRVRAGTKLKVQKTSSSNKIAQETHTKNRRGYHTVKKGENLSHIAKKYKVSARDLIAWNKIENPKYVKPGQKLKVSGTVASVRPTTINKPKPVKSGTEHIMKSGESLYSIAKLYGVSSSDLKEWNDIEDPKKLRPGKVLIIKKSDSSKIVTKEKDPPKSTNSLGINEEEDIMVNYKIKPGDTLWDIARSHGVTIAQLKKWNKLSDASKLRAGDKIAIYR